MMYYKQTYCRNYTIRKEEGGKQEGHENGEEIVTKDCQK